MIVCDEKRDIIIAEVYSDGAPPPEATISNFIIVDGWPWTVPQNGVLPVNVSFYYKGPEQDVTLEGSILREGISYADAQLSLHTPDGPTMSTPVEGGITIQLPGAGFLGIGGIPEGTYDVRARIVEYSDQATYTIPQAVVVTKQVGLMDMMMPMVGMMMMAMMAMMIVPMVKTNETK